MMRSTAGKEGLFIALVAAAVMSAFSMPMTLSVPHINAGMGICAPSPNLWHISVPLSWLLNNILFFGIAITLIFANKKLLFTQGQDFIAPVLFLIFTAADPPLTSAVNSSTLMCAANLACIILILNAYEKTNATQDLFVVATIAGLGTMIQYAFVLFVPVYLISAASLQLLRPKEICAFFLGLVAPFWTFVGLGIVSISDFSLPYIESVFTSSFSGLDLTFLFIETGIVIALGLYSVVSNTVNVQSRGIREILFNRVIIIFGGAAVIFACIDFLNLRTYIETIYLVAAIQAANAFEESKWRYKTYALLSIAIIFLTLYLCIQTS